MLILFICKGMCKFLCKTKSSSSWDRQTVRNRLEVERPHWVWPIHLEHHKIRIQQDPWQAEQARVGRSATVLGKMQRETGGGGGTGDEDGGSAAKPTRKLDNLVGSCHTKHQLGISGRSHGKGCASPFSPHRTCLEPSPAVLEWGILLHPNTSLQHTLRGCKLALSQGMLEGSTTRSSDNRPKCWRHMTRASKGYHPHGTKTTLASSLEVLFKMSSLNWDKCILSSLNSWCTLSIKSDVSIHFCPLVDCSWIVDRKRVFIILGLKDLNSRLPLQEKKADRSEVNIENGRREMEWNRMRVKMGTPGAYR